jgi:myo-inositol-1(or 4)-monophosphatase
MLARMNLRELRLALAAATEAANAAGSLLKANLRRTKKVNEAHQHDIKLELDVRCQKVITRTLLRAFPDIPVLGEEGQDQAVATAPSRWVVDPIDGTVNFACRIPHAAVSIALQGRVGSAKAAGYPDGYQTVVGVVLDPFVGERFTAIRGQPSRLNGRPIRVSSRCRLEEAIVCVGFAKSVESLELFQRHAQQLTHRVRKLRIMGSAALALAYVADGRFDAYVERGIRLWDVAAGALLIECAGGEFWNEPLVGEHVFALCATNGRLRRQLDFAV